jgi:chromosomal replication initiator protein
MDGLWEKITVCLKENLSSAGYQTLISSATPKSFENNVLTIEVPNLFSKEWIKDKCEPIIRENCDDINYDIVIDYLVTETTEEAKPKPLQLQMFNKKQPTETIKETSFNPKYTLESFIIGDNNRFAFASSEAVSKAPAKAYNPLFIYGPVGLGKTHLLHGIGNSIQSEKKLTVKLVSCEKFTNDLINAIKMRSVEKFRQKYRTVDVLLVDDVHFLAGKEQTQEEFFHTFNDLYNLSKQIILTSDRPPKEIPTLEDRLRTRFEWGLIADIQAPDLETRIAILQQKAELNHYEITDEILHFIATQIPTNVREMEGALTRIFAYASLLNTEVTLNIASTVIRDLVGIKKEKPLTIATIQKKVGDYFNVSSTELASKSRTKEIANARQICMYLARELTNMSLPRIGESFGNRDHTTVMHACDKIKSMIKTDSELKNVINILITNIKQDT